MSDRPIFRASFEHDIHLGRRDRKQLAVHMLLARTLQIPAHEASIDLEKHLSEVARKIRQVSNLYLDLEEETLSDFVEKVARNLRPFVKTWHFGKHGEERRSIARFLREVRALRQWRTHTSLGYGDGVGCLGEMFVWLVAIAEKAYTPVLQHCTTYDLTLRFCTLPRKKGLEVSGETKFETVNDTMASRAADVSIRIPLRYFSDAHFCQLPFFIFHEIFVHGPQAWATEGCRKVVGELCALREGFVDAAAYAVLVAELEAAQLPSMLRPFCKEVISGIGEAHRHRSEDMPSTTRAFDEDDDYDIDKIARKFRKLGKTTFERVAQRDPDIAGKLALCLNLIEFGERSDGIRLVDRLDHALSRPTAPAGQRVRDKSVLWLKQVCSAAAAYDLVEIRDLVEQALSTPFQDDSSEARRRDAFSD